MTLECLTIEKPNAESWFKTVMVSTPAEMSVGRTSIAPSLSGGSTLEALLCLSLLLSGCGDGGATPVPVQQGQQQTVAPTPEPPPPTAITVDAGPDLLVHVGDLVTLHGTVTSPTPLPICWSFVERPLGSAAVLKQVGGTVTFIADLEGGYILKLRTNPNLPDCQLSGTGDITDTVNVSATVDYVTVSFGGTLGTSGSSVNGNITYALAQGPIATDVNGLKPNVLYSVRAWKVTVIAGPELNAQGIRDNLYECCVHQNRVEFCQGICVFGTAENTVTLRFANDTNFVLNLYWTTADPTPTINPPANGAEWGVPLEWTYRVPCPVCSPLVFVTPIYTQ